MSKIAFIALNTLGLIIFVYFASLQYEDDNAEIYANPSRLDVWIWITFYGLVAVLFALALFGRQSLPLLILAVGFCVYQLAVTAPGLIDNVSSGRFTMTKTGMSPDHAEVELTREFFGALIALAGVAFVSLQRFRKR